ncbi:MAG: GTPase domain-containing protein [Acidaminococcaceae bacterium]|nr:GTPase domain-containing protein [Acidaminococcaceae bacterium]MBQ7416897.1 GTPase domain-containing protein [Acidaminococcaceae bacterium]MBQ8491627.1 GTPase domain-containing protein [Acidaminococcaceae bacterium]
MMVKIWNRTGSKIPNKKEASSNGKENLSEEKQKKVHRPTVRNILVLGKTGVGKTSLLNYLYGFDLPVGAGLPKTGKGIHENLITRNGTAYHVFDTWGIEADSLPEWRKEVLALVRKRNTSPHINDWFHAVYYCFSASTARIEDAEIDEIIVPLLQSGCKMIVVLTNSEDGFRKQEKIAGMKEYLREELVKRLHHDPQLEIIPVASVAGETLAGDAISRFGRTEVLEAAQYNLADDIEKRLPAIYKMNVMQKLGAWKERSLLLLANGKISFVLNNNSARQLIDLVNYDLLNTFGAIDADGDKMEAEANEYLLAAGGKKSLDRRWRPEFSRITYVKGYEYSKGLSVGLAFDVAASLLRSAKSIRENLSRRVVKTYEAIIESMQKK